MPSKHIADSLQQKLQASQSKHQQRELKVRRSDSDLINFASNDYLGLSQHPDLTQACIEAVEHYGVGSGASPWVSGYTALHEACEAALAGFVGKPAAMLFNCGYMANMGVLTALADPQTIILHDRLNHASLLDAGSLATTKWRRYRHCDVKHLTEYLQLESPAMVVTEGVFSMDGDIAPLIKISELCRQHDALLIIDDAHALGVLGHKGQGSAAHFHLPDDAIDLVVGTLGKAFGTAGAFISGSVELIHAIRQFARSYMFSTAMPPLLCATTLAALEIMQTTDVVSRLQQNINFFHEVMVKHQLPIINREKTAIQPFIVGKSDSAIAMADAARDAGFWIGCMRPPAVPKDTDRLRITLRADHSEDDITQLVALLAKLHKVEDAAAA